MKQFVLVMPDGQELEISDSEELCQKIKSDGTYSMNYADDSQMNAVRKNGRAALIYSVNGEEFLYSLADETKASALIKHMSFHPLPEELFLPETLALQIIIEFFHKGTCSERITWLEGSLLKHFMLEMPNGSSWENPDLDALYPEMICHCSEFFSYGDCIIRYYEGEAAWENENFSEMLVGFSYVDGEERLVLQCDDEGLLSLHDESRLKEIKETNTLLQYSAGLFLPKQTAWLAIREFLETGKPSDKIRWISLEEAEKIKGANH